MESLAHTLSYGLVVVFLIGMVGSLIVVLITVLDDIREFFEEDEAPIHLHDRKQTS